ncbi:hypothetical protein L596_015351 [Steinernema carpocapsae]|uniref:Uncharacterized protein n=1 Tax=Steinernema carpocapsae TaxID=34508 RepID=A0A4U5NEX7_STECR|nr:hypothetical protein L596_015351 [Steinernema carpocapsae]
MSKSAAFQANLGANSKNKTLPSPMTSSTMTRSTETKTIDPFDESRRLEDDSITAPSPEVRTSEDKTKPNESPECTRSEEVGQMIPDNAIMEKTLSASHGSERPGEDSEQLSDLSEEGEQPAYAPKKSALFTWHQRISPLIRSRQVRYLAMINCVLSIINIILFLLLLGLGIYAVAIKIQITVVKRENKPCIYEWGPWSACSASCTEGKERPRKTRRVDMESVVQPRGGNDDCPSNLENLVDWVPCNLYKCPKNLSDFDFSKCFFNDPFVGAKGGCFQIRHVTDQNILIKIDTDLLTRNCIQKECDEKEKNSSYLGSGTLSG